MMATQLSDVLPPGVQRALNEVSPAEVSKPVKVQPMYQVIGDTKVAVSKANGKVWKGRIDSARTARKKYQEAWDEALKYYENDQLDHRTSQDGKSGNTVRARRMDERWSETENLVFANIKGVLPAVYAKNPKPEITMYDQDKADFGTLVERVVYVLSQMDAPPGLNLKVIAKQAVTHALLTNCAWVESGWIFREDSSEQALLDLQKLSEELRKATKPKEIEEIEGKLQALESRVDFLNPAGPYAKYHPAHRVYVDPAAGQMDFGDANWMAVEEWYPTDFLRAQFATKGSSEQYMSLYEPTHVLLGDTKTAANDADMDNFKLFKTSDPAESYGYKDTEAFKKAQRTKCWRIWDKTTRRIFLYADSDWTWPIWVWDDKYQLPRFFPLRNLAFHSPATGAYAKGEVTYYLDQQDAINEINSQERFARMRVFNKIAYDAKVVDPTEVEKWLNSVDRMAYGMTLPEGKTMKDAIFAVPPPSLEFPMLFNKQPKLEAINRISGTSVIQRNEEFKTNTTNKAIENYESSTQTRLDEKLDAIEDFLGGVYYDVAHLCLMFMQKDMVVNLIGAAQGEQWVNMDAQQIRSSFQMRVLGGSTQKPTTSGKKKEAIAVGQVLGQFGASSPTVIEIVLRLFSHAFDEIEMRSSDWDRLRQEAALAAGGGGEGPAAGAPPNGAPPGADVLMRAAQIFDGLPPQAKVALGTATAKGVPLIEAIQEVIKQIQVAQPGPQAPQPTPPNGVR